MCRAGWDLNEGRKSILGPWEGPWERPDEALGAAVRLPRSIDTKALAACCLLIIIIISSSSSSRQTEETMSPPCLCLSVTGEIGRGDLERSGPCLSFTPGTVPTWTWNQAAGVVAPPRARVRTILCKSTCGDWGLHWNQMMLKSAGCHGLPWAAKGCQIRHPPSEMEMAGVHNASSHKRV